MSSEHAVSRRKFMGGAATAVGALGLAPSGLQGMLARYAPESRIGRQDGGYDALAKLSANENPYGPSPAAMKAMEAAWKYSNRYGYPDGDVQEVVAGHLGVPRDHVLLTAGSEEVLKSVGIALLGTDKKVVGVDPSYGSVYRYATGIHADAIKLPLLDDHSQNVPAMIKATNRHHRGIGFVYLCNPNNPTGNVVPAAEVRELLDAIPDDVPVLVDEAYHHFVEDPRYESAVPYVKEGRNVIVARTFSKIYGMAGMRLGYAVAAPPMLERLRTYATGSINALVKWGGAASIKDTKTEAKVRKETLRLRKRSTEQLAGWGFEVIPSETNFFMVRTGRPVQEVRAAFREEMVAVGRPFPPMLDWLRVSVGTEEEMDRFTATFRKLFAV